MVREANYLCTYLASSLCYLPLGRSSFSVVLLYEFNYYLGMRIFTLSRNPKLLQEVVEPRVQR